MKGRKKKKKRKKLWLLPDQNGYRKPTSCWSYVNNTAGVFLQTQMNVGKQIVIFFHHFMLSQVLEAKKECVFPF